MLRSPNTSESSNVTTQKTTGTSDKYKPSYTVEGRQILIVYGTEYGFSEEVSRKLFDRLSDIEIGKDESRFQPRMVNAKDYTCIDWEQEQICLIIISTSGDGVPPTDAREFCEFLTTTDTSLKHICYSVMALGDTNYPQFCKTGKQVDQRMSELLASCITDRSDVDMEDWSVINRWMDKVVQYLSEQSSIETRMDYLDLSSLDDDSIPSRHNPFMAVLKVKKPLTFQTSEDDKETIHCEFDITDSGLSWTSGDALGIYPENNPSHVENILKMLEFDGTEKINTPVWAYKPYSDTGDIDLYTAILKFYDLKFIKIDLLQLLCDVVTEEREKTELQQLLQQGTSKSNSFLYEYINEREVRDVLENFNSFVIKTPKQFVSCLKQLQPRYYSISSSPIVDNNTVCVTAAVVRYKLLGQPREGVTTTYLQDRLEVRDRCPVFMSRNPDFRLPSNNNVPVILIGPGTGIAPFRAFIQEKEKQENPGPVYLYFGCRHRNKDFLYKEELGKVLPWKQLLLNDYENANTILVVFSLTQRQNKTIHVSCKCTLPAWKRYFILLPINISKIRKMGTEWIDIIKSCLFKRPESESLCSRFIAQRFKTVMAAY
ncbi:hypothetical protein KUTeg_010010 [Tegillarca granosa]|uniref:NADPH-dependent diflavin oxidoreductase 1 n=1 Tax=Tegillarca granosa TaxID=220873 RepID=A0ABQ9F5I4_TEGGR|nr:hypothetical protein KUTeg_010010 [Tegillarca granosa]